MKIVRQKGAAMAHCDEVEICDEKCVHEGLVHDVLKNMPDDSELYDLSELFKVFGDYSRMRILTVLFKNELCVCDIAELLSMTQSAISHQLSVLKKAKLIVGRREGKQVFYSLADDHVRTMIAQGIEHVRE